MPDNPKDTGTQGGFDDWLEEEPGPDTDPYASLEEDDVESEIADWMAFTEGAEGPEDATEESGEPDASPSEPVESDDAPDASSELVEAPDESVEVGASGRVFDQAEVFAAVVVENRDEGPAADDTGELEVTDEGAPEVMAADEPEVTAEIDLVDVPDEPPLATSVDIDEWIGDDRADTDEIPIVAGADVVSASVTNLDDRRQVDDVDEVVDVEEAFEIDDTGEMEVIEPDWDDAVDDAEDDPDTMEEAFIGAGFGAASASFGELWADEVGDAGDRPEAEGAAADAEVAAGESGDEEDAELFELSKEHYLHTATKEHVGLAAAVAEAEDQDTEQVALAAPIPGLESTVVGFDDVVQAEGHGRVRARKGGDLLARVITGIVLVAALAASLVWRPVLLAFATAVFVIGAGEFYTALARTGRHPISIFGFVGVIGASVGAYFWGAIAIPVSFLLVSTLLLLYYAVVPGRDDPTGNLALTVSIMAWAGLGAFAIPIAAADDYRPLIIGVVVVVAAMDITQYFVGRALGRHQLSPWVSPKKTIEGLAGGVIVALGLGAALDFVDPFDLKTGLVLGATVAVLSPLGDLAMSAAKRSLRMKDMGSILPGHGGFMDRIDGLLFVIPAAWAILLWAGLL